MNEHVINWGGDGPILHLAHANSFHPGTYLPLINELKKYFKVFSILFRPLYKDADFLEFENWDLLRDDLISMADEQGWKDIIGIGHSLGSTITTMAAIKRPDIFSKVVIIEPPCVNAIFFTILDILPYPIAKNLVPPSRIALKRRHKWPSRQEAFDLLRPKKIFEKWPDESLKAYLDYGLEEDENGEFRLVFSKYWESKIYCTIENPYKLFPQLEVPALCVKASESDVISEKNWIKWQRIHKNAEFIEIPDSSHLLPMEKPIELASAIREFGLQ